MPPTSLQDCFDLASRPLKRQKNKKMELHIKYRMSENTSLTLCIYRASTVVEEHFRTSFRVIGQFCNVHHKQLHTKSNSSCYNNPINNVTSYKSKQLKTGIRNFYQEDFASAKSPILRTTRLEKAAPKNGDNSLRSGTAINIITQKLLRQLIKWDSWKNRIGITIEGTFLTWKHDT